MMDQVLSRDQDVSQVYIDDIAVYSTTWEDHCAHTSRVLGRLKSAGLTANVKKCLWGHTQVEFLGHVVGRGQVSPARGKIDAVRQFPIPRTKKQVRQFLGITGYYRKFVRQYAEHTFNLTEANRKSSPESILWSHVLDDEYSYFEICVV